MKLAISFTNFGPYHLARLRALAIALKERGDELVAYETAGSEDRYPWRRQVGSEPFEWITLFSDRAMESIPGAACRRAMHDRLEIDRPDALAIVGYARPESMAMLNWGRRNARPTILLSESQEIDHPRVWWKEAIKSRRVRKFSSGFVGGQRHANYLAKLGIPSDRIAFGYNAVDNAHFTSRANAARIDANSRNELPRKPYFIADSRFVPEKNFVALVQAYARYRDTTQAPPWDLVLCGDGETRGEIEAVIRANGLEANVHLPGFLQADALPTWFAHAAGFVHPSLMEPWGLVANEAAACGLPLLISDRAGCVETLVPEPKGTAGLRFDPRSIEEIAESMQWLAEIPEVERQAMGGRAFEVVSQWGPDRFAHGMLTAIELASDREARRVGRSMTDRKIMEPAS